MSVCLKVVAGKPQGANISLHGKSFLIGRDSACQLRPKHDSVGSRHCALKVDGNAVDVEDLGSEGGTLLNGTRLDPSVPTPVRHGDRLQIGPLVFEFAIRDEDRTAAADPEEALDDQDEVSVAAKIANKIIQRELGQGPDPMKAVGIHLHVVLVEGVPCVTIEMHRIGEEMLPAFRRELGNLAERPSFTRLILDFRKVHAACPGGAEVLLAFEKKLRGRGARLKICELTPEVMAVMGEHGVLDRIPVFLDCHDAIWSAW